MQGKLILPKGGKITRDCVESAAHFAEVEIIDSFTLIDDTTYEVKSRSAANLIKFGRYLEKVDGTELKAAKERQAKKEAAAKKA